MSTELHSPEDCRSKSPPASSPFYYCLKEYLEEGNLAKTTQDYYRRVAKQFLVEVRPWEEDWTRRAMRWRDQMDVLPSSLSLYVTVVRKYIEKCMQKGLVKVCPLSKFKTTQGSGAPRRALTRQEVHKLLATTVGDGLIQKRDRAILLLMLYTGIRVNSVFNINLEDIDDMGNSVTLKYLSKGHKKKDTFVVLPEIVYDAICYYVVSKYGKGGPGTGPAFTGIRVDMLGAKRLTNGAIRKMITRRMKTAGLQGVCPHSLRHTAASMAVKAGADLLAVKEMLGHRSIQTTERYVHSLSRVEDAAELKIDYGLE